MFINNNISSRRTIHHKRWMVTGGSRYGQKQPASSIQRCHITCNIIYLQGLAIDITQRAIMQLFNGILVKFKYDSHGS